MDMIKKISSKEAVRELRKGLNLNLEFNEALPAKIKN